jgi:hypothetical protein
MHPALGSLRVTRCPLPLDWYFLLRADSIWGKLQRDAPGRALQLTFGRRCCTVISMRNTFSYLS